MDVFRNRHDVNTLSSQYGVTEPRKQAYADFYKQYDTTKEFNNMREAGVFESVRPTGK